MTGRPRVGAGRPQSAGRDEKTTEARHSTPEALLALCRPDLLEALRDLEVPSYRYAQVCRHLLSRPELPFSEATTLPAVLRATLDSLGPSTLRVVASRTAPDGTTKLLLSGRDGAFIETVVMRYRDRVTVCLSSQVGCPVGCAFCATGVMGFSRNLSVAEIVDQVRLTSVLVASDGRRVSNLVYMGMGEPLLNLQAVLDSIRVVTDPIGIGLAHRAVSVSSVGIPNGIVRLAREEPQVNLALSLHAADDRTRALLVPQRFRHSLAEILGAAWEHFAITHRKLLVEYVLLGGVNDSPDDARRLAALLRGHVLTVNLLPWNAAHRPTRAGTCSERAVRGTLAGQTDGHPESFSASPQAAVVAFRDALLKAGVEAVIRRSKGSGIHAACGQLAGRCRSYDVDAEQTAPPGLPIVSPQAPSG